MKALLTTLLLIFVMGNVHAATKGRIMTDGKVSMYQNGKMVNSFTNQGPIDENSLIACDGNCLVKIKGISLMANDQSRFAVKELAGSTNLYLENGKISFAISDTSKQFSFFTADGYYITSEGFISPASTNNSVKGYMQATDRGTEIGMDQGTMVIQTDEGIREVKSGQAILLAQLPPGQQNNTKNDDDDDDKGAAVPPCPFFDFTCKTPAEIVAASVGAGALGFAGYHFYDNVLDDDDTRLLDNETRSASPNQ
ncbi:MAG: hypothetical protein M8357_12495 [Desulfobulbaceae bacterium]|nr:hypothetical protein [Desulfobulbaceae bacterium]